MNRMTLPLIALLLLSSPAYAAPVLFDNRDAFNAAVGTHTLFTDFALEHVPLTYDFAADFAGLAYRQEGFEIEWGDTLGINGVHTDARSAGLYMPATQPIIALGFDLLDSWSYVVPESPTVAPTRYATDAIFQFTTTGGETSSTRITPGAFFGVLLYDDAFAWLTIATPQPDCMCRSGLTIDNLAVQQSNPQVPEPSTMALLGLGLTGIAFMRRRK